MKIKDKIKQNINADMVRHALRIIFGMLISVLIAEALNVKFAPSAAVITLLCIQSTKRDTLKASVRYTISFLYTIVFAVLVHLWLGIGLLAFFVTTLPLVLFSFAIGFESTISVSTVVIIHLFIQQQPFTPELVLNELIRVIVGVAIAIIINWKFPDDEKSFKKYIAVLESNLSAVLKELAKSLMNYSVTENADKLYSDIEKKISDGLKKAYKYAGNNFSEKAEYYIQYMNLREAECVIIRNLIDSTEKIVSSPHFDSTHTQNLLLADYINTLSDLISPESDEISLKDMMSLLKVQFESMPMPDNNDELICRFVQFSMMNDLDELLQERIQFKQRRIDK